MASFAGPESIGHAFGNRCEETAVFWFRFPHRTGQAAENSGRDNADIGPALKSGIAGDKCIVKFALSRQREQHAPILMQPSTNLQPQTGDLFKKEKPAMQIA